MKTITLTDDQFNTLFFRIDRTVKLIIDASVEYQNSDLLKAPLGNSLDLIGPFYFSEEQVQNWSNFLQNFKNNEFLVDYFEA